MDIDFILAFLNAKTELTALRKIECNKDGSEQVKCGQSES